MKLENIQRDVRGHRTANTERRTSNIEHPTSNEFPGYPECLLTPALFSFWGGEGGGAVVVIEVQARPDSRIRKS